MDMKLEVVIVPVSDVDRAKQFYKALGWREDADFAFDESFRVIQMTPPGSACSIHFGTGLPSSATPGSAQGLYLMATTGLGNLLGSLLAGEVVTRAGGAPAAVFVVPLVLDVAMLVALLATFRPEIQGSGPPARRESVFPPGLAPAARARTLAPGRGEGE